MIQTWNDQLIRNPPPLLPPSSVPLLLINQSVTPFLQPCHHYNGEYLYTSGPQSFLSLLCTVCMPSRNIKGPFVWLRPQWWERERAQKIWRVEFRIFDRLSSENLAGWVQKMIYGTRWVQKIFNMLYSENLTGLAHKIWKVEFRIFDRLSSKYSTGWVRKIWQIEVRKWDMYS